MPKAIASTTTETFVEQRSGRDRRRKVGFLSYRHLGIRGRRKVNRRDSGVKAPYLDHYDTPTLVVSLGIILLCGLDAAFTLNLLSIGAVELNSIMAILIEKDVQTFVNIKIALTSLSVILLVIHKDFRLFRSITVGHASNLIFASYIVLIIYEIGLFQVR